MLYVICSLLVFAEVLKGSILIKFDDCYKGVQVSLQRL